MVNFASCIESHDDFLWIAGSFCAFPTAICCIRLGSDELDICTEFFRGTGDDVKRYPRIVRV